MHVSRPLVRGAETRPHYEIESNCLGPGGRLLQSPSHGRIFDGLKPYGGQCQQLQPVRTPGAWVLFDFHYHVLSTSMIVPWVCSSSKSQKTPQPIAPLRQ